MRCDLRLLYPGRDRSCPPGATGSRCRAGSSTDRVPRQLCVVEAARGRWGLGLIPGDVGVAEPKAELLVEVVAATREAREVRSMLRRLLLRQVNRGHGQGCADAVAAGVLVDNDMFDRIASSESTVRQPGMVEW